MPTRSKQYCLSRGVTGTVASAVALLLLLSVANAQTDRKTDPLYTMLDTICASPGFSLAQRIDALGQWREPKDEERANILPAVAEAWVASDAVHGLTDPGDAAQAQADRIAWLDRGLAEPVESERGAMRLLVKSDNPGMALLISTVQGSGLASIGCRMLLHSPGEPLVGELARRYNLFPARQNPSVRSWRAQSMFQTPKQRQTHDRGLTVMRAGDKARFAVIEYAFTVIEK